MEFEDLKDSAIQQLASVGIHNTEQLVCWAEEHPDYSIQLIQMPNIGIRSLIEIKRLLPAHIRNRPAPEGRGGTG